MPDEVYDQLQELPEKWNNLKKKATIVKQNVAPLQANEVNNIRKRAATFDVIQYQFRERFRQIPPLRYITKIYPMQACYSYILSQKLLFDIKICRYDCTNPYEELDHLHISMCKFEADMEKLIAQAALFEVNVPDYRQLKQCRKEVKLLKQLWDYIYLVRLRILEQKRYTGKDNYK